MSASPTLAQLRLTAEHAAESDERELAKLVLRMATALRGLTRAETVAEVDAALLAAEELLDTLEGKS